MISQNSIQEVKDRVVITEVIRDYVELKPNGVNLVGKCPFHNEKTPSFTVSKSKGIYKCFGCSRSGDAITFVMEHEKLNYVDAIKVLAAKYYVNLELESYPKQRTKPEPRPHIESNKIKSFFTDRGITDETIKNFKISFANEWMPIAKKETEVICFNYYKQEELVNIKFRGANKDFKLCKDAELVFYNIDSIGKSDYVIITEGEIDCLTIAQCGMPHVISVPNGASKGNQKLEYLDNCWQYFEDVKTIVLFTDNDEPGLLLRDELSRRLGKEKCFKVTYPEDCKDPNEIYLKYGKDRLLKVLKEVSEFPIEGIISMTEMYEDVSNYYLNGYPTGVKVGILGLDDFVSFLPGQITTITGIPGSGKSEFLDHIITQAAKNHGWEFGICSFENQPSALHVTKLMEKYVGKSFAFRYVQSDRINQNEFKESTAFIDRFFHFININTVDVTLDGILQKGKELVVMKGIKGIIIDPWNYIEHKVANNQTETQYISECLTKMKAFALKHGVHIFLVAHPTKLKKENNKYEVPTLYSISGSAHFFNKTDNGLSVYRNFDTNVVDIYIQKVRYSWLGKIGYVSFNYNTDTRQYQLVNN